MNICSCFEIQPKRLFAEDGHGAKLCEIDTYVQICNGTKEREECSCGGDVTKCNFYPEKREQQRTLDDEYSEACKKMLNNHSVSTGVDVIELMEDKTMNTAEMYLAAQKNGKTYRCNDVLYSVSTGMVDRHDGSAWPMDAFEDFDELMRYQWHDDVTMTRKEAEEKLGVRIID